MKFNLTHAMIGVGLIAALVLFQRKKAAAAADPAAHNSEVNQNPGHWWTYPGAWS
jgi:hypothetical protein